MPVLLELCRVHDDAVPGDDVAKVRHGLLAEKALAPLEDEAVRAEDLNARTAQFNIILSKPLIINIKMRAKSMPCVNPHLSRK
jgi:hypothetical protein